MQRDVYVPSGVVLAYSSAKMNAAVRAAQIAAWGVVREERRRDMGRASVYSVRVVMAAVGEHEVDWSLHADGKVVVVACGVDEACSVAREHVEGKRHRAWRNVGSGLEYAQARVRVVEVVSCHQISYVDAIAGRFPG